MWYGYEPRIHLSSHVQRVLPRIVILSSLSIRLTTLTTTTLPVSRDCVTTDELTILTDSLSD